jgi:hypothetical protein
MDSCHTAVKRDQKYSLELGGCAILQTVLSNLDAAMAGGQARIAVFNESNSPRLKKALRKGLALIFPI